MMQIKQIAQLVKSRSGFSNPGEVYVAINAAAKTIYDWVLKECKGSFIKTDTSSVVVIAGTDEYALPADLEDLIRVRERINSSDYWRKVNSAELDEPAFLSNDTFGSEFFDDPYSHFKYFGPYRDAAAAAADSEVEKFRIGPIPQDARQIELIYRVKFIEITSEASHLWVPAGAHDALLDIATAEILDVDDDDKAVKFRNRGMGKLTVWLYNERRKLLGDQTPQVEPYI